MLTGILGSAAFHYSSCCIWGAVPCSGAHRIRCERRIGSAPVQSIQKRRSRPNRQLCRALSGKAVDVRHKEIRRLVLDKERLVLDKGEDKRRSLLRFVQEVQPHDVLDHFQRTVPPSVLDAMRTTATNLLGTLPPQYFNVTISANVEDLAQIMCSMLMTGYMYRNAQYRIDLEHVRLSYDDGDEIDFEALQRLGRKELESERKPAPVYADGTQLSRVTGSVLRWRKDTEGLEEMDAQRYIRNCEDEIASLKDQLARNMYAKGSGNELLDFIKVQEPNQLKELTENASSAVIEAMNSFVQRLVGNELRKTESTATELARVLYFLMVVGYSLRQLEVKCDFESSFTVAALSQGSLTE